LQEVENATVDWQSMQRQIEASSAALEAASKAESLARLRHDKGLASYFEVVDAQRVVLSTELALKQIEGAQVVAAVQLLRALGGGWQ
jgi:multidrug efflux system outer membrane protein